MANCRGQTRADQTRTDQTDQSRPSRHCWRPATRADVTLVSIWLTSAAVTRPQPLHSNKQYHRASQSRPLKQSSGGPAMKDKLQSAVEKLSRFCAWNLSLVGHSDNWLAEPGGGSRGVWEEDLFSNGVARLCCLDREPGASAMPSATIPEKFLSPTSGRSRSRRVLTTPSSAPAAKRQFVLVPALHYCPLFQWPVCTMPGSQYSAGVPGLSVILSPEYMRYEQLLEPVERHEQLLEPVDLTHFDVHLF